MAPDFPVIFVDAWSHTCLSERGDGAQTETSPELTWRDRRLIQRLQGEGKLDIRELRAGLEIVTRSHIGYVPFERFGLRVRPAISHSDMLRMITFAYGIDQMSWYDRSALVSITDFELEDLLIAGLIAHVRKLARQGLFQAYVEEDAELATVRGSVRFAELATRTWMGDTLPCRYGRRTPDVPLNQLLTSGLIRAQQLTRHRVLLGELRRLQTYLEEHVKPIPMTEEAFRIAERALTRLNQHYRPALDLCYLLHKRASLDEELEGVRHFPGFLLDMNDLFERFVGRLLEEIVPSGHRVEKQSRRSFYTAPPGQAVPLLRPDFRILDSEGRVVTIVDAKYKFLDRRSIDVSDLYQLTIYGMADDPNQGSVFALYPASPEQQAPDSGNDWIYYFEDSGRRKISVVFRRVRLSDVWEGLTSKEGRAALREELLRSAGPQ